MTTARIMRNVLGAVVVVFVMAGRGHTQPGGSNATAERLFNEARELVKANRWAEACPKFEASLREDPALGTRLNLATCYEHIGQVARAWGLYHESIELADKAGDVERRDFARTHADALESRLARLAISAPATPPAGFIVTRDGTAIDAAALGVAVYVDAGRHEIVASAPGFARFTKVVTLIAGKTETLAIPSLIAAAAQSGGATLPVEDAGASTAPLVAVSSTRAYVAIGVGAVGVATVGVGLLFGATARSNFADAKSLCGDKLICEGDGTYRLGQQLIHDARSNATISTVLVAAGGAAIIAGAVVFLTRPHTRESRTARIVPAPQAHGAGFAIVGRF